MILHRALLRPAAVNRSGTSDRCARSGRGGWLGVLLCAAFVTQAGAQNDAFEIFDEGVFVEGNVEIINGQIIVKEAPAKVEEKPQPDPAGDQVMELTDGSQLHGKLLSLGKNEVVWQRADATEPLTFTPQEVRRLVLSKTEGGTPPRADATIKLSGSDWLAGQLTAFDGQRFQLKIGMERAVEIPRERVEWIATSPTQSPDAYDGPMGPMGMAGWDAAIESGANWDYADGALVAKNASPIVRQFEVLPDRMDIQFTAGDGGSNNRGLTLWIQPGTRARGYGKGSCYLRFQSNTINGNYSTGDQMKNFSANIVEEKDDRKMTRYRLLFDRREGRMVIFVNGKQVADWDMPECDEPLVNGNLSWQPSYWSANMAWTLSSIRLQPWDGALPPDGEEADKDILVAGKEARRTGALDRATAEAFTFSGAEVPRKTPVFIRFAAVEQPELPGAIARVWLAQRGQLDVTGIGFRDGVLKVRASFGGELALPASAVRAIEFPHKVPLVAKKVVEGGDVLVFHNGDQLRGTLLEASHAQPLRWKPVKGDKVVEFSKERLAGVLLASRLPEKKAEEPASAALAVAARLHNGDWLPGELQDLNGTHLTVRSKLSGNLRIARDSLRSLYMSTAGEAPVWDGASERDAWTKGVVSPNTWSDSSGRARRDDKRPSPWRYLDGSFTLLGSGMNRGYGGGPNLGRTLQAMPEKVDLSFVLRTTKGPASYSIQLFFDENKPGFMVQGGWDSAYLYDMAPRRNGGAFFNQPQQLEFGDKIGSEGNERRFRFLADRKAGRIWMFVNERLVGSLSKRVGGDNPKGKGISIMPQPMMSRVSISNLWIAPWSGTLPPEATSRAAEEPSTTALAKGENPLAEPPKDKNAPEAPKPATPKAPPTPVADPDADAIALTNGDETTGKVLKATGDTITMQCDVGEIDVPLRLATLVEFAQKTAAPNRGVRLRFAEKGALTVDSFRIENDRVICASAATGELAFPLSQLSEIIYHPDVIPASSSPFTPPENNSIQIRPAGRVLIR